MCNVYMYMCICIYIGGQPLSVLRTLNIQTRYVYNIIGLNDNMNSVDGKNNNMKYACICMYYY